MVKLILASGSTRRQEILDVYKRQVNIPTVFVSGGPMLAGKVDGKKTSLSSMFEAVGSYAAGQISADKLEEYECKTCPTCGSCSGMYLSLIHIFWRL